MDQSPKIDLLIAGCWLGGFGVYATLGIFLPKLRGRWGRRGTGVPVSLWSQVLWAMMFIIFGGSAILSAYHQVWLDNAFPYVFFPLFATLIIMGWRDNRDFKRDDKDVD